MFHLPSTTVKNATYTAGDTSDPQTFGVNCALSCSEHQAVVDCGSFGSWAQTPVMMTLDATSCPLDVVATISQLTSTSSSRYRLLEDSCPSFAVWVDIPTVAEAAELTAPQIVAKLQQLQATASAGAPVLQLGPLTMTSWSQADVGAGQAAGISYSSGNIGGEAISVQVGTSDGGSISESISLGGTTINITASVPGLLLPTGSPVFPTAVNSLVASANTTVVQYTPVLIKMTLASATCTTFNRTAVRVAIARIGGISVARLTIVSSCDTQTKAHRSSRLHLLASTGVELTVVVAPSTNPSAPTPANVAVTLANESKDSSSAMAKDPTIGSASSVSASSMQLNSEPSVKEDKTNGATAASSSMAAMLFALSVSASWLTL